MVFKGIKILKSPPNQGETLNHDAPVLRIMQLGLWCFIVISSITVFFGVHSYVSDYLNQQPWLVQQVGYLGAYLVLSIIPDLLCSIFFAHVVRSLLKQQYKDILSIILNVALILIVLFLGRYSWRMSRSAATSAAYDMVPAVVLDDVTRLDSLASGERQLLRKQYEDDVTAINQRFDRNLEAALLPLRQKALPYRKRIESLENSRSQNNTSWIDKQLTGVNQQLLPIEEQISAVTASNERRRSSELSQLKRKYQDDITFLNNRLYENRERTQQRNGRVEQRVESLAAAFSGEFRKIAGWSIIIVLILTALLEILYHRNGIERNPVFTQWNFRLSGFFEVLYLPFSVVGRHTLNAVRRQYAKLPALEPEPDFKQKFQGDLNRFKGVKTGLKGLKTPVKSSLNGLNDYEGFFYDDLNPEKGDCEGKSDGFKKDSNGHALHINGSNGKYQTNGHYEPTAAVGGENKSVLAEKAEVALMVSPSTLREDLPVCALPGCEKRFVKTVYNKKYCCDDHKQDHYELRTGKKLHPKIRNRKTD